MRLKHQKRMSMNWINNISPSEIIMNYLKNNNSNELNDENLKNIIQKYQINCYFKSLQKNITSKNIHNVNKHEYLEDGVYLLLKGQINYISFQNNTSKQSFPQIENQQPRNSQQSVLHGTNSFLINENFTVFQCQNKNCISNQDSILLYLNQEEAQNCGFYQLKNQKIDLYTHHYLSKDHKEFLHIPYFQNIFTIDPFMQHIFTYKVYTFRSQILLTQLGIVTEGLIKINQPNCHKVVEFSKYGVLLIGIRYQVLSSELKVLIIKQHENLKYNFNCSVNKNLRNNNTANNNNHYRSAIQNDSDKCKIQSNRIQQNKRKSTRLIGKNAQNKQNSNQMKSRNKNVIKIAQQLQNYTIVSMYQCGRSLKFSQKSQLLQPKQKKNQYRKPMILFDVISNRKKKFFPKFNSVQIVKKLQQKMIEKNPNFSSNNDLMKIPIHKLLLNIKNSTLKQNLYKIQKQSISQEEKLKFKQKNPNSMIIQQINLIKKQKQQQ